MPVIKNDAILQALMDSEYGAYMKNPLDNKARVKRIGINLFNVRTACQITQKQVCDALGCTPQTYSGYELGKHDLPSETLVRLSYLFGVTTDTLLDRPPISESLEEKQSDFERFKDNVLENEQVRILSNTVDELSGKMAALEKQVSEMKKAKNK